VARGAVSFILAVLAAAALTSPAAADAAPKLRAGAGQADVQPPQTGYYLGGFTRADRLALGQHTRLFAKTILLERGGERVALVSLDLFMIPAGMQQQIARLAGLQPENVLILPTHTHSGPGGFANFPTYNTAAPSPETIQNPASFAELFDPKPADRQLYTFLVTQITKSIRRAARDLGPAVAGWGSGRIVGLTRNRSLEAHLADHGIIEARGEGAVGQDPAGSVHTIDPNVDVLRVDKVIRGRRVPIGGFSSFANHGTVVKAPFQAYNGDHHATAHRVFEQRVRRAGDVPKRQLVLNVYGNSNEGDMSAGLDNTGPAGANYVGRVEAKEMFAAWKQAGRRLTAKPELDLRWTRTCFCGREAGGGRVAAEGRAGAPFFTGSEEERGPLFDVTGVPFEDRRSELASDTQGHKIVVPAGDFPRAVPLTVARIGDRAIAALPGEPTKETGARTKSAVLETLRGAGVRRVVIAGLANDFISYITTPEEYERQHYEGGSTLFGVYEQPFLTDRLVELGEAMASGDSAPEPYPYDPENGVAPDGPSYPQGAASGTLTAQPDARVRRLGHAEVAWSGGPLGHDRPLEKPFVVVERRSGKKWKRVDSDLGLAILWRVDEAGDYTAYWEVPRGAKLGTYRLRISATRYGLTSDEFRVVPSRALTVVPAGSGAVRLEYPVAEENVDLLARPRAAKGGEVTFDVGGDSVTVRSKGKTFRVPGGGPATVAARAARDAFGNTNADPVSLP
jgi:hypothetical protein